MSILTKEERANLRIVDRSSMNFWSPTGLNDALDTIDALEAERGEMKAELSGLARESVRREIQAAKMEAETVALQRMFLKIHDIAYANHDTRVVGGAHAALREILAVFEGVDAEEDLPRGCSKCAGVGFVQASCTGLAHKPGNEHMECRSCPGGWGLTSKKCDVCAADGEGER